MTAIRLAATAAAALVAGLFAQGSWAACYIVYGADKQIIYRSQLPPVDMSRPLHETVPRIAPGGTLVFSLDQRLRAGDPQPAPRGQQASTARRW
jgi:hypothetical protein